MYITRRQRRKALWIGLLLATLLVTGCAGIKPYEARDYREEGPEKGLLSGPDGEFIIYRKVDEPESDRESGKGPDEPTDGEQQKMGDEEKKEEIKNGDQQP